MSWKINLLKFRNGAKRRRYWIEAKVTFAVIGALQFLPMKAAIDFNAKLAQFFGPFLPRQKLVMENLERAFPEKSHAERLQISRAMWRNMGRLVAEYVFLDRLFDYDPNSEKQGMIEVEGEQRFRDIQAAGKPCIFFTGHIGNFELLPVCAAVFDLEVTALFRPPNNPHIAKRLLQSRRTNMGHLVPSRAGAAWGLAKALEDGTSIGVLVDQKFNKGELTTFFGHPVRTNPLLPKLARKFEVPIYPARCIRIANGRYKLILEDEIKLPRNAEGIVDINASTQMLNDIVERWVRKTPDQWMWMHRRWKID